MFKELTFTDTQSAKTSCKHYPTSERKYYNIVQFWFCLCSVPTDI